MARNYCSMCSNFRGKRVENRSVTLHRVPRDKDKKRAWLQRLKLIRKDLSYSSYTNVCSEHFVNKKGPIPGDDLPSVFDCKTFKITEVPYTPPVIVVDIDSQQNDRDSRDATSGSSSKCNAGVMQCRSDSEKGKLQESRKRQKELLLQEFQIILSELQRLTWMDCAIYLVDREEQPPKKMLYGYGPIKRVMLNCGQLHQRVLQAYNIPAMKKTSLLSSGLLQNNLNVAGGSSSVLPSATPVSLPSATPVSLHRATSVSLPSATPVLLPSASPVSLPRATLSLPNVTPVSLPSTTPVLLPSTSPVSLPRATLSLPSTTPVLLPSTTPVLLPSPTPVSLIKNVARQGCSDTIGAPYTGAASPHIALPSSKTLKVIKISNSSSNKTSPRVNLVYNPASQEKIVVKVEVDEPDEMLWRSRATAERTGEVEATNPHHQGECHAEAEVTAEKDTQTFENNFSRTFEKAKQAAKNASPHASAKKPSDHSLVDNCHNNVGNEIKSEPVPSPATEWNTASEMHVKIEPFEDDFSRTCEKRKQTAESVSPHASAKKPRDHSLVDNYHNNVGDKVESVPVPSLATESNTAVEMHLKLEPEWD